MAVLPTIPGALSALGPLRDDLQQIFGARLHAIVAHGPRVRARAAHVVDVPTLHTLVLVEGLAYKDLEACAQRAVDWRAARLAIPLLLSPTEFRRSLDAFPLEYGEILAHHFVVYGESPFAGAEVRSEDLRVACERWAKAHRIHLREGYIETGGRASAVAQLIVASASPFAALLAQVARLRGDGASSPDTLAQATEGIAGLPAQVVRQVLALEQQPRLDGDSAMTLFPAYLEAVERLVDYLDGWARN
jgi:hypothetical protein